MLQLLGFMELIHLFRCQTQLCHGYTGIFGEAEMVHLGIADANAIRDLIPIIIGIEGVAALGFQGVIQFSIAAGEVETLRAETKQLRDQTAALRLQFTELMEKLSELT